MKRIAGCGLLTLLLLLVPLCSFAGLAYIGLSGMREESPSDYAGLLSEGLGIQVEASVTSYDFSNEDLTAIKESGLDPQEVGDAILASEWADEVLGKSTESAGDPTILIALGKYESGGGCQNCGTSDAAGEYAAHPALDAEAQKKALQTILAKAKEADIRSKNSNAAKYVYEDYSGALGSKGGGALGCDQLLAGTAVAHLETVGSPDLWDSLVAKKYMAAELYKQGWRPDLSDAQKLGVLLKWNSDPNGLTKVIETAKVYLKYRDLRGKLKVLPGDWKASLLGFLGLLPERVAYAAESWQKISGSWQFPIHGETLLASDSKDHLARGSVPAWDFWAMPGTSVYPARPGDVVFTSYNNEGGYGHWVMLDHGNGSSTIYAHLGTIRVKVGDPVECETPLGEVAQTGMTSFPHTHLEIRQDGVQMDPAKAYGQPEIVGLKYTFWSDLPVEKNPWR
ncbi:MAG: M23 family metallopeptidase [bacterium]|nr:M23 family metallopeptidase [bacterium]